jgi:hypothetical protein
VSFSGTSKPSSLTVVRDALKSTLSTRGIAFSTDMKIQIPHKSETADGTGRCDVNADSCEFSLSMRVDNQQPTSANGELIGDALYIDTHQSLSSSQPTKWISVPLSVASRNATLIGEVGSPLSGFMGLASRGVSVIDEGDLNIKGVSMHQYVVTSTGKSSKNSAAPVVEILDVNTAGKIGQVTDDSDVVVSGIRIAVEKTLFISSYGVPVRITAPPASEVTPLSDLSKLPARLEF